MSWNNRSLALFLLLSIGAVSQGLLLWYSWIVLDDIRILKSFLLFSAPSMILIGSSIGWFSNPKKYRIAVLASCFPVVWAGIVLPEMNFLILLVEAVLLCWLVKVVWRAGVSPK